MLEGPRAVNPEEVGRVIDLINWVFRESQGLAPTMGNQYPTLLGEQNCDNMRAFFDGNKPVATLNLYKSQLLLKGCIFNVAFVGSVATHPDYRRRGLGGDLVRDGETKMKNEGVDLVIISGTKSIYTSNGYSMVTKDKVFYVTGQDNGDTVKVEEFGPDGLREIIPVYMDEPVRFYRSRSDFNLLYQGGTYPWGGWIYKSFIIKRNSSVKAYVVIRIKEEDQTGELVEWAGDRPAVYNGLCKLYKTYGLRSIKVQVPFGDWQLIGVLKEKGLEPTEADMGHTVKIINFQGFMNKLLPYIRELVDEDVIRQFGYSYDGTSYSLRLGEESLDTKDVKVVNRIFFGNQSEISSLLDQMPNLKAFLGKVCPLPLPYLNNLNYI